MLLWAALRLLVKNWARAGLLTSLVLILFYTYGHVYAVSLKWSSESALVSGPKLLLPLWGVFLVVGVWLVLRKLPKTENLTNYLHWVGVVLLAMPLYSIISFQFRLASNSAEELAADDGAQVSEIASLQNEDELPDIYYIVLDGYAREDTLAELYDHDNSELINYLEQSGFFVGDESYSNYDQTFLSLPSSLNMAYFTDLLDVQGDDPYDHNAHVRLVRDNQVRRLLEAAGYQTVSFHTGHGLTTLTNTDHYLKVGGQSESPTATAITVGDLEFKLNPFEVLLLETSALRPLFGTVFQSVAEGEKYQQRRDRIHFTFSNISRFAQEEGNYFVFAHIIAPHPPFVFLADGEPRINLRPFSIADGSHFVGNKGTRGEYITGYREQLIYTNTLLMAAIEDILMQSETPPVIIVQADHGPGAYFEWNLLEGTDLQERYGILNAYYLPGGEQGWLYPSITPVNSFRVVFNRYLGADFELLPDEMYFSNWSTPYDFVEITDRLVGELE